MAHDLPEQSGILVTQLLLLCHVACLVCGSKVQVWQEAPSGIVCRAMKVRRKIVTASEKEIGRIDRDDDQ